MKITCTAFVILIQTLYCLASDDSEFQLTNKGTDSCLPKIHGFCSPVRWTTGDRLMTAWLAIKCLGVQGKSVGSEISLYDCDENSELQKWECRNGTLLALKGQELYISFNADNNPVLSNTIGPNNHLTISQTASGACTRTSRELYTIGGNAYGRMCMFPFQYKDRWYMSCTTTDSPTHRPWCAVETKYDHGLWGYCPTTSKEHWEQNPTTGEYYQLNTQSALTWFQADVSCKQQGASLLSITDPHQQAYVTALLARADRGQRSKLWIGLALEQEHGWQWTNRKPYRYLNWDSGHPLNNIGHSCAIADGTLQFSWQSSTCTKKLGYICYSEGTVAPPTEAPEGFCSPPWIPYNGHCFHLDRAPKTWSNAQKQCRMEGGDLVSIQSVEDQSFVISQLGYASTDELWIGLNDRKTESLFDWSDHSTVHFTSWEFGNPAISAENEDCVLIRGENGNWANRGCEEKHGYICMKLGAPEHPSDEVDQNIGCRTGWKRHGSYCYFVGTQTKTFDEAKDECKSSESYLVDVSTGVDNAFLVSLVGMRPEKHFWLGLSNQRDIDEFEWTNTKSVKFTHWNTDMPGQRQGCVAMTTGFSPGLWDVLPCTNQEKYICKHLADGASLTPAPPIVPPPKCADGWTKVASGSNCYKVFSDKSLEKRTWYEARDYCMTIGGDLLSIHSSADQQIIYYRRYDSLWIGLSAPDPMDGFIWSDRSPVNFQHWEDGEPNNRTTDDSCVQFKPYISRWTGSWSNVNCKKKNGWLCQIRAGKTPKPPPDPIIPDFNKTSDGWIEWNGYQYFFSQKLFAIEDARHFCQQRHGDLVSINSNGENTFLWNQISEVYGHFWIGLSLDIDGASTWNDGSQMVFQNWYEGQPKFKNYDETCAFLSPYSGSWHAINCGYEFKFICKRSGSTPVNTTAAPTVPPKGGCLSHWKRFNSKCYTIITDQKLTWDDARTHCKQMGGNLASIPSRHVEAFLITQMADTPTTDLWIGLHSRQTYEFLWTDGQPRSYVNLFFNKRNYHHWFNHQGITVHRYDLILEHYYRQHEDQCTVINTSPVIGIGKWLPRSCNDTNGFVCLKNLDPYLPDNPEPPVPKDYVKIGNDSFKVVTQPMTWDGGKKYCEDEGATLACLQKEWSYVYIELMALNLKAPLWIGLNKMQTNGYFKYINGWHMTFSRWGENEPSTNRPCVYVDVDGKWKTGHCNETINSVCMKSPDVPPTEPSIHPGVCPVDPGSSITDQNYYWQPFKGYCYMFFLEEKKWADAAFSCVAHGGSLASIEDPSEQEFIQRNLGVFADNYISFWIGLYKSTKGEWLWLDTTVMDYSNWDEGQPEDHDHGEISSKDGTWKGARKENYKPYICKTPKVPPPTPSPTSKGVLGSGHRDHIMLAVVLVISVKAIVALIVIYLCKRSGRHRPIPDQLTNFENPLFFSNSQSTSNEAEKSTAEKESHVPVSAA